SSRGLLAGLLAMPNRTMPPYVGAERELLNSFLEFHRATLELKCEGVAPDRLAERTVPPSNLTLHGLVRHLAGAEQWWFHHQFAGGDGPLIFYSVEDSDRDFDDLSGDFADAVAA